MKILLFLTTLCLSNITYAQSREINHDSIVGYWNGYGQMKLYNSNKQLAKEGIFKNYRLMDGLWYRYDDNNHLIKIERYENGKYVEDVPLQ